MNNLRIKGINFTGWTVEQINHRLRQPHSLNLTELYYLLTWLEKNTKGLILQWQQIITQSTGRYDYQLNILNIEF
jgi:hypothetical protein